jgi:hypothetical protein
MAMDSNQFGDILEIYQPPINSVVYKMVNSIGNARDLAQETFIKLWYYCDRICEDKPVFSPLVENQMNEISKISDDPQIQISIDEFIRLLQQPKQQRSQNTLKDVSILLTKI